jgi:hypothetical protein
MTRRHVLWVAAAALAGALAAVASPARPAPAGPLASGENVAISADAAVTCDCSHPGGRYGGPGTRR